MRGDIVHHIFGLHAGRANDSHFGTYRTVQEAEAQIQVLLAKEMNGGNWAAQYHNKGFVIRTTKVDTDFAIPSLPKPRDRYFAEATPIVNRPGAWETARVEVLRRDDPAGAREKIYEYQRNYRMLQTFEPFRQGSRSFALMSSDYTRTSVLDLDTGKVIAEEPADSSFCPVGFYVPDWWDVHHGRVIPGSPSWNADDEWPNGAFGFVWGCCWGDDSSWKVQHLDLSRVQDGVITRSERYGYLELSTRGFGLPSLTEKRGAQHFIRVSKYQGRASVTFAVEMGFDLESGQAWDWQRLRNSNLD